VAKPEIPGKTPRREGKGVVMGNFIMGIAIFKAALPTVAIFRLCTVFFQNSVESEEGEKEGNFDSFHAGTVRQDQCRIDFV